MKHTQVDRDLAFRHVNECEVRIEEQRARITRLKEEGQPTDMADDLLRLLLDSRDKLRGHLALMTDKS